MLDTEIDEECEAQLRRLRTIARSAELRGDHEEWLRAEELILRALENLQKRRA